MRYKRTTVTKVNTNHRDDDGNESFQASRGEQINPFLNTLETHAIANSLRGAHEVIISIDN